MTAPTARDPWMRLALISNPRSRRHRRDTTLTDDLTAQITGLGRAFAPADLDALDEVAQAVRDEGVEVVAVSGGDGTSHRVLSALHRSYGTRPLPMIHLLRSGTMNTLAGNLDIRGRPRARMAALVERMRWGQGMPTTDCSTLVVDGQRVGVLFGLGAVRTFLEVYYAGSDPSPAKAAWVLVQLALSAVARGPLIRRVFQPVEVRVTADGVAWPERSFSAVAAGTVADIGLGFRPFPAASAHPDKLQLLGFSGAPWTIVVSLPRMLRASPLDRGDIRYGLVERVRFEADAPIPYMMDGDLHQGDTTLELACGPRVRFVADHSM